MKGFLRNKEYFAVGIFAALFILGSYIALKSIRDLQGHARVVNHAGIVRGGTQRLIKKELMNSPDDALVERLTSIVDNLLIGKGKNNLIVLQDNEYLNLMKDVKKHWSSLQNLILHVRRDEDREELFDSSQAYFVLVDKAVFAAEAYSESQINKIIYVLINISVVFAVCFAAWLFLTLKSRNSQEDY